VIVLSGALAVVAFALLIAGLVAKGLALVYVSIAVSVVAMAFLALGAYQRRGEVAPGYSGAGGIGTAGAAGLASPATEDTTAIVRPIPVPDAAPALAAVSTSAEADEDEVLVVAGRPRYHVAGCRYIAGKDTETRTRSEALAEGFSACGVCKPDEALAGAAAAASAPEPALAAVPAFVEPAEEPAEVEEAEPVTTRRVATTSGGARKATTKKTAAKSTTKTAATKKTAAKTTAKATTKSAATKAPAKKTAAAKKTSTRTAATVVVIPDRGKFHTNECRFVRDADATLELTKAQARRQGYEACGVCKP
jgi:hypothetical protein